MTRFLHVLLPVLFIAALAMAAAPDIVAAQSIVRTQQACWPTCGTVGPQSTVTEAQSFTFKAPGKGIAVVEFEGTLYCGNNSNSLTFIDIVTQITDSEVDPAPGAPGDLEFLQTFEAAGGGTRVASFNLASTRVFNVKKAGRKTYRLRVLPVALPTDTGCSVRGGAFTVTFHPRRPK